MLLGEGISMDKEMIEKTVVKSLALLIVVYMSYFFISGLGLYKISTNNLVSAEKNPIVGSQDNETMGWKINTVKNNPFISMSDFNQVNENIVKNLGGQYLIVKKPSNKNISLILDNIYIDKCLLFTFYGVEGEEVTCDMIARVNGDEVFLGQPAYRQFIKVNTQSEDSDIRSEIIKDYGNDIVHGISITTNDLGTAMKCQVLIQLDKIYEYICLEDDNYYYIELRDPKELYDKILVIDAGHGGKDPGAISSCENYLEKEFNLEILLELKRLLKKENIKVYYTRLDDRQVYLRPRVGLANELNCDFFISIHCNSNLSSRPNGSEVLYYDDEFNNIKTEELASIFSQELGRATSLKSNGLVKKKDDDIFILEQAQVPAVLIEVAYLSNYSDLTYLKCPENIKKVAEGIYQGIIRVYDELGR